MVEADVARLPSNVATPTHLIVNIVGRNSGICARAHQCEIERKRRVSTSYCEVTDNLMVTRKRARMEMRDGGKMGGEKLICARSLMCAACRVLRPACCTCFPFVESLHEDNDSTDNSYNGSIPNTFHTLVGQRWYHQVMRSPVRTLNDAIDRMNQPTSRWQSWPSP